MEWISLGSAAWKEVVGETYGATDKPLVGGMPAFGDSLTETELRQVAFYERVRFAERDPDTERDACGL